MKTLLITTTLILTSIVAFSLSASEDKEITIADEAMTISYDFSEEVTATASVPDSPCRFCLRNFKPSECLEICDVIIF